MANGDIGPAILEEIKRFGVVSSDSKHDLLVDTSLGALKTRLEGVDARPGALESGSKLRWTRLETVEPRSAVLETVVTELTRN